MIQEVIKLVKELGYDDLSYNYIEKTEGLYSSITELLSSWGVNYETYHFHVLAPKWVEWELTVNGREVPALPSGLVSGEVSFNLKDSSDLESGYTLSNVNFNSKLISEGDISTPIFYWSPALSTSKKVAMDIIKADKVEGYLKVKHVCAKGRHVLAGNLERPRKLFVVHYDALWRGVIDNGLSVATFLNLLKMGKVKKDAVLFLGFSEISIWPAYWEYSMLTARELLNEIISNSEVIVVDCIGYKNTSFITDKEYIDAYSKLKEDLKVFGTPMKDLLEIYHSTNDGVEVISVDQLEKDLAEISKMVG